MTPTSNHAGPTKPVRKSRLDRTIQITTIKAITLDELWQKIAAYAPIPKDRQVLLEKNLIEALNLDVSPTIGQIYAQWQADYRANFNAQLAGNADSSTSTLTPEQRRITELAFSLPNCEDMGQPMEDADIEKAYLAVALELRAYFEREDDEDEGPLWCKKKHCAS